MANLGDISEWLRVEMQSTAKILAEGVSLACLDYMENITQATPADTSRAVSNWQLDINKGFFSELDPYSMGTKGSTKGASRGQAIALADARLSVRDFGDTVYMVNRIEYMVDLNTGTSPQASAGFVDGEMTEFESALDRLVGG